MDKIIDGKVLQKEIKEKLVEEVNGIDEKLKLVVIQVGNNDASNIYVRNKGKLCKEVGIDFCHQKYDDITESNLIKEIEKLNDDKTVTGILVQLPLPSTISEKNVIEKIAYYKDVDGLTSKNIGNLFAGNEAIAPCTALGVMEILKSKNVSIEGENAVIVGRSKLVGLPLIALLLRENATVTTCHSKTQNLKEITKEADILVVAIGKKEYIDKSYIKDGAVVIDVGINREDGKLYGDCNKNIEEKVRYMTPVPGGVGPLTVIMLINNIIKAHKLQKKLK